MELLFLSQWNWCLLVCFIFIVHEQFSLRLCNCFLILSWKWGGILYCKIVDGVEVEGVVPWCSPNMFDVFLNCCFVYFLHFIVKLLNIIRFSLPQRMRIDDTEGIDAKPLTWYSSLKIQQINVSSFFSLSPSPCLVLTCILVLSARGYPFLPCIYRVLLP